MQSVRLLLILAVSSTVIRCKKHHCSLQRAQSGQCQRTNVDHKEGFLLQRKGVAKPGFTSVFSNDSAEARSSAADSLFLIMSTFGPTVDDLSQLNSMTHQQWVNNQMDLPIQSHRAYYRQRVNPRYSFTGVSSAAGVSQTPCSKGARWTRLAFSKDDVGLTFEVKGTSAVYINGVYRTNINMGIFKPTWGDLPDLYGKICEVEEEWNGEVIVSGSNGNCYYLTHWFSNVPLNFTEADAVSSALEFTVGKFGEMVVNSDLDTCDVTAASVVEVDGMFFRFQERLRLNANTPEDPSLDSALCVSRNAVNSNSCQAAVTGGAKVLAGWIEHVYIRGWGVYKGELGVDPDRTSVVDTISLPSDLSCCYSLRWTGFITIISAGEYWFKTASDDGSQVLVDGVVVVDNGGFHATRTVKGSVTLAAGSHNVIIDFFQGGGGVHMKAWYKGSDTGNSFRSLDSTVVSATVEGCAVACGSPGEVESSNEHSFTILGDTWDGVSNQQVDTKYEKMPPPLSKSAVWTMLSLTASDQLRQRVSWALWQIFDVSSSDSSDGQTEMWLNYYDIFVRNSFGNLKDLLREVVYSPIVGVYRQHQGSSSFEYDLRFPKENLAQHLLELCCEGHFSLTDVVNIARVLTGFTKSVNQNTRMEYHSANMIDPMYISSVAHDIYPKPDLNGNFLGDGRPLCQEIRSNAFLKAGAQFEFLDVKATGSDVLSLSDTSLLGQFLCGGSTSDCKPSFLRNLTENLVCNGDECSATSVVEVEVSGFHFLYLRPVCVHLFFEDGDTVVINDAGEVQQNDGTVFQVPWADESPAAAGSYVATVTSTCVFHALPSVSDVQSQLTITIEDPDWICSVCDGDVKAHVIAGAYSSFEVDGVLYSNTRSNVELEGLTDTFRNPPVFVKGTMNSLQESRAVEAEVEALLDHLVTHETTPQSFGKRFIQRMGSLSPSATYLADVAEAFKTGSYDGISYPGSQGNLAATVAAVILHPEALRMEGWREPMLKIIHVMRSMGYEDLSSQPIVFTNLLDTIGQFPFAAATVPGKLGTGHLVGYLNVITALIRSGVSNRCDSETDVGLRVRYWDSWNTKAEVCPQGELTFISAGNATEVLGQLNVLLTGGRLNNASMASVQDVYAQSRGPVDNIKAAQQAIAMSVEFNTLGPTDVAENAATALLHKKSKWSTHKLQPYKAAIFLFMEGGADTFNMIVPQDVALYTEYSLVRQDLALQTSELLAITTTGQTVTSFGVHSSLDYLKSLYDIGQAAFVANIGSLVAPTTYASFSDGTAHTCAGLFAHGAQIRALQTLSCQVSGNDTIRAGSAGGRLADALAQGASAFSTSTFSMYGLEGESVGLDTPHVAVDENHQRLDSFEFWRGYIDASTSSTYLSSVVEGFSRKLLESVQNAEITENVLAGVATSTTYNTDDSLRKQFYDVSRLIGARVDRSTERDLFYVRIGGFDHHENAKEGLNVLFEAIDTALEGFVAEMVSQDIWSNIVVLSTSEFGRTLTSSGDGSDHGWAGNHFIVGGSVSGGQIFNHYPASLVDNDLDLGRGRLIPEHPWESVMVPVAQWLGLDTSQLPTVFPNIENFSSDDLILYSSLFSQ